MLLASVLEHSVEAASAKGAIQFSCIKAAAPSAAGLRRDIAAQSESSPSSDQQGQDSDLYCAEACNQALPQLISTFVPVKPAAYGDHGPLS